MMQTTSKWAAMTAVLVMLWSALIISGCASKQAPGVQDDENLAVPELHKQPAHNVRIQPLPPRPTTRPEKTVPTKDNPTAAQATQEIRAQTNRAEQAAASAEQARAKARSASTAAEQAASKAEQAAAKGDAQRAATAADAAAASAAAAKEAAMVARQHANQAQQHAQSATAATTAAGTTAEGAKGATAAAEKADSAATSAFGHSLLAAQQAKRAQQAVEIAGKVAIVTAGASQIGGSAKRAATQSKIAKAKAKGAQKAAASGDVKTAGAEAGKAQKAADQATVDARQANERLGDVKKTIGSITSDKRSGQGVRDAAGNALADAQRSVDAAQAAALAAEKSALAAKQLLQRAKIKAKQDPVQPKPTTKPAANPTSRPSTRPAPKSLTRPAAKNIPHPKSGDIDMTKLPKLPKLPPRKTTPKGIITPTAPKAAVVRIKGRWLQVSGSKGADFLPGGYHTSRLVFRKDGILEVRRTFDKEGNVSVTWCVGYKWNKDGSMVTIGGDETDRPLKSSLKGFEIEDSGVKALDAVDDLPVILKCTRLANGRIRLSGRIYKSSAE